MSYKDGGFNPNPPEEFETASALESSQILSCLSELRVDPDKSSSSSRFTSRGATSVRQKGNTYNGNIEASGSSNVDMRQTNTHNNYENCTFNSYLDQRSSIEALCDKLYFSETRKAELRSKAPLKGSCQWLYSHETYVEWDTCTQIEQSSFETKTLVLVGKPGCGKSCTVYAALQRQRRVFETSSFGMCLAFFFSASVGGGIEASFAGLLRSLLHQLLGIHQKDKDPMVTDIAKAVLAEVSDDWTSPVVQNAIHDLLSLNQDSPVVVFVDGLDECEKVENDKMDMHKVLEFLEELANRFENLKICMSTRDVEVVLRYGDVKEIDVSKENTKDIRAYALQKLTSRNLSPADKLKMANSLQVRSSGMFLWVKFVLQDIRTTGAKSIEDMMERLDMLPKELTEFYEKILGDLMNSHVDGGIGESVALFQVVYAAARPLRLSELQSGLGLRQVQVRGTESLKQTFKGLSFEEDSERIRRLSRGMIELVPFSSPVRYTEDQESMAEASDYVLQFLHTSVREFLESKGLAILDSDCMLEGAGFLQARCHLTMLKVCLQYLNSAELMELESLSPEDRFEGSSLIIYACALWTFHARKSDQALNWDVLQSTSVIFRDILQCEARTQLIIRLFQRYHDLVIHSVRDDVVSMRHLVDPSVRMNGVATQVRGINMLALLSYEGCTTLVQAHARRCLSTQSCCSQTHVLEEGFRLALRRGWTDTADIIRAIAGDNGDRVDLNLLHRNRITLLYLACTKGDIRSAEYLLKAGADPFARSPEGPDVFPLHAAVANGNADVVRLFLKRSLVDADPSMLIGLQDGLGRNILHRVATFRRLQILEILQPFIEEQRLEHVIRQTTRHGQTALHTALVTQHVIQRDHTGSEKELRMEMDRMKDIIHILNIFMSRVTAE